MAEALWHDVAVAYDRSFADLWAGTTGSLMAQVPSATRVLDVGCGSGHVAAAFVSAGHDVHDVDPDPEMVAMANQRSAVEVHLGGRPDLPYEKESSTPSWPTSCITTWTTRERPHGMQ